MPVSEKQTKGKLQKAAALSYRQGMDNAPRVIASGRGELAKKIIETARSAGIDIVEDGDLVEILAGLPTGEEIPPELYQVVAELLACLYRLNGTCSAGQA